MLRISQADYDLIRWEAERRYPLECCGILLGTAYVGCREVSLTVMCENAGLDPQRRYSILPEQLIATLKLARSRHENIIGFYHSHPDRDPHFSPTDLAEANYFQHSYVITGVRQGRAMGTESFVLTGSEEDRQFEPEEIRITSRRTPLPRLVNHAE
ncbi:MAG TPA: M67 family metallopeptidase [Candidatus Saccharimonadales bacterium]|jgi:proteasome lid subunit RPN8/RPN11|nr:M67 family metallopeptidase [Candidatus Saccharimonadales bacterium]